MKGKTSLPAPRSRRGRPPKFGRPSQLTAITLPEDTIRHLQSLDPDLGWAIVRLVEQTNAPSATRLSKPLPRPPIELVRLPGNLGLILVSAAELKQIPGVSLIPLSDGRAFIALSREGGLADLELAIVDRMESLPPRSAVRANLEIMRKQLREWRRNPSLKFRSRALIIAEGAADIRIERLPHISGEPGNGEAQAPGG